VRAGKRRRIYARIYYQIREQSWIDRCLSAAGRIGHSDVSAALAENLCRHKRAPGRAGEAKVLNIQRVQQEDLQTVDFLKTVEQTLQNHALIERVIERDNLLDNSRLVPRDKPKPTQQQLRPQWIG
jgi:hypothetical protein